MKFLRRSPRPGVLLLAGWIFLLAGPVRAEPPPARRGTDLDHPGWFGLGLQRVSLRGEGSGDGRPETARFQMPIPATAFVRSIPVAGDFDGDGRDSVSLFDPWTLVFHLRNANEPGPADLEVRFGALERRGRLLPIVGDFNGDGIDTIGTYEPATARFRLRNSNTPGTPDVEFAFGPPGGVPVTGDFDGDGIDTVGVYDPVTITFRLRDSLAAGPPDHEFLFGVPGSIPFAGDFDGDGIDTIGTWHPPSRSWRLANRNAAVPPDELGFLPEVDWERRPIAGSWQVPSETPPPAGFAFPEGEPSDFGIDPGELAAALDELEALDFTHAGLVLRDGTLLTERYFRGYDRQLAGNVKSVSKSMLSATIGLAIEDGWIDSLDATLERLLPSLFTDRPSGDKRRIRLRDLLTMRAGIAWNEADLSDWFASPDWARNVLDRPALAPPGSAFLYSTGLTHLGSRIVTEATGEELWEYMARRLFRPLGIRPLRLDREPLGFDLGGAELWMVPRDMARFGEAYRDNPATVARSAIPAEWRNWSTRQLVPPASIDGDLGYGAWWWRKTFAGRDDVYFAWGYGGQFVFLFPSLRMNVVVTSSFDVTGTQAASQAYRVFDWLQSSLLPIIPE